MTDRETLIARLEAASEGSRELDVAVWDVVKAWPIAADSEWRIAPNGSTEVHALTFSPAYTTSLDATVTLVPEGSDWTARTRFEHPYQGKFLAEAVVWSKRISGFAQTPALALCIACLRAREVT